MGLGPVESGRPQIAKADGEPPCIGYDRAARVMDQLEKAGILGPPDGSKPRDVLIDFTHLGRGMRGCVGVSEF
jgi:hypothetical protein